MPILSSLITRGLSVNSFSNTKRLGANVAIQYLVVAGGGGSYFSGYTSSGRQGGGGAGGYRTGTLDQSGGSRLTVLIGAGGSGASPGSNSSITAGEGVWSNVISDGGGNGDGRS